MLRKRIEAAKKQAKALQALQSIADANAELGQAMVNHEDTGVPCPICCRERLRPGRISSLLPNEDDIAAPGSYNYRFMPQPDSDSEEKLHWHTDKCPLCQSLHVPHALDPSVLQANENFRRLERHHCRRPLTASEEAELCAVASTWNKFAIGETERMRLKRERRLSRRASLVPLAMVPSIQSPSTATMAISQLNLGYAFSTGLGTEVSWHRCAELTASAASGPFALAAASYNLGVLALRGIAPTSEENGTARAVRHFREAADKGYIAAIHRLALLIQNGVKTAVAEDRNRMKAADCGGGGGGATSIDEKNAAAEIKTSSSAPLSKVGGESARNRARALEIMLDLVALGHRDSCADCGGLLATDVAVAAKHAITFDLNPKSDPWSRAFIIWSRGASLGCAQSTYRLGKCYRTGIGAKRSPPLAFQCYAKAAAMGHRAAAEELAFVEPSDQYNTGGTHGLQVTVYFDALPLYGEKVRAIYSPVYV